MAAIEKGVTVVVANGITVAIAERPQWIDRAMTEVTTRGLSYGDSLLMKG